MNKVVVYSKQKNNRLQYVLDWLIRDQLAMDYELTDDESKLHDTSFLISYGQPFINAFCIPDAGLLWQQEVTETEINCAAWYGIPTLFAMQAEDYTLPFDLLSAIFFLLSRYEEYYTFTPDKHGRYPATQSILYKKGWLRRPLLDEWVHELKLLLQNQFGLAVASSPFSYKPTYDIDIAFSYLNKGLRRTIGAFAQNMLSGNMDMVKERAQVLLGKKQDPYDSFDWLKQLHYECACKPDFFILSSLRTTAYDKNIPLQHPEMEKLVKVLAEQGRVGIHPSYYSKRDGVFENEKKALEKIISSDICISRQHYIRVEMPGTYHMLLRHGIDDDYSMGYGSHLGFRAGTGQTFNWYDIQKETATNLCLHPFCFMDTTAFYEEKLDVTKAFGELQLMKQKLQQTNSTMITIFHNFSLGNSQIWKEWKEKYKEFVLATLKYAP